MTSHPLLAGLYLLIYVSLSVGGLTLIKLSESTVSVRFLLGAVLYGSGFLVWIFWILRALPLSIAFPLAAGTLMIGTQLGGWIFLKEEFSGIAASGVFLIICGTAIVYWNQFR